jgi:NitT/TauT family transport system substrate-binding protein
MHETGMIKSSPQRILAEGSDFQFLKQITRELKS